MSIIIIITSVCSIYAVASCVPTPLWPPVLGILNVRTDVDARVTP